MPIESLKGTPRPPSARSPRLAPGLVRLVCGSLFLWGVGCSDSTAPASLNVVLSAAQVSGPTVSTIQDTLPLVSCSVDLSATASGADTAVWVDGVVRLYGGVDRSTPLDSVMLSASDLQNSWGNARIGAGQTETAHWKVQATLPFRVEFEYRYRPRVGTNKTTDAGLDCGPKIPAGTPAPSVDTLGVFHPLANVQPGDTLTISYRATSPVGILQTAVELSGPCSVRVTLPEQIQTAVTRSVRLGIPATCQLGVPLTVSAFATDAALQTGSRALATQIVLVDSAPPVLDVVFDPAPPVVFAGDSVTMHVTVSDNRALAMLGWEVLPAGAGDADSLTVTGQSANRDILVRVYPGASGPIQFRLYARDGVGNERETLTPWQAYPTVVLPADSVYDGGPVSDAIADPRRQLVYAYQEYQAGLEVVSLATKTVTQTIPLPEPATDFDVTPGGDSLIVALGRSGLGIIDLRQSPLTVSLLPLDPVDSTTPASAGFVRTTSNGKVFVSLLQSGLLDEVDLATGAQRIRRDAGDNGDVGTARLGRSFDHSVMVLNGATTDFQRYDAATDQFGSRQSTAITEVRPTADSTGGVVSVLTTLYDGSLQLLRQAAPTLTGPTVLSADGTTLYVINSRGVVRARVSDGSIVDRITHPGNFGQARISDDGSLLAVVGGGSAEVLTVIHLR